MNLLFKQLLISVPLITVMGIMVTVSMFKSTIEEFYNQCYLQMVAILELSVKSIDGGTAERITDLECVNDGSLYQLNKTMREIINSNKSIWSGKYSCRIYSDPSADIHFLMTSGNSYDIPFIEYTKDTENMDHTTSFMYDLHISDVLYICAASPIYNSDGKQVAYFELMLNAGDTGEHLYEVFAEAAKMLYSLLKQPEEGDLVREYDSFSDVKEDDWYAPYVKAMYRYGIMTGYADGSFQPQGKVTRAQFVKMLEPFVEKSGDISGGFSDVSDDFWAAEAIAAVSECGVIFGYPDGTFRPDDAVSYAEMGAMFLRTKHISDTQLNAYGKWQANVEKYLKLR